MGKWIFWTNNQEGIFIRFIASTTFTTLTISLTSWTRTILAPCITDIATTAAVPSSLSSGIAFPRIFPMKAFLEGPINRGFRREENFLSLFIISRLCSNVLPKPIPGSIIILSSGMPAFIAFLS